MKSTLVLVGAGSLLLAGSAFASGDETFDLGSHTLGGSEGFTSTLDLGDNAKGVTGFSISFDYDEPVSDGSWASDVMVVVTSPTGASFNVGGFDNVTNPWAFDGSGSDGPGNYGETFDLWPDGEPKGLWTVSFTNDWGADQNPNDYNNITVTFHKIPAPGALALLGIAGVAGRRRRRA